jgi:hypothetical protein
MNSREARSQPILSARGSYDGLLRHSFPGFAKAANLVALLVTAFAACSSPSVGDTCPGTCPPETLCEVVCACGNASCPAYACVVVSSTGSYKLEDDGGLVASCSTP